jgi:PAS domain S-box-containing protein
MIKMTAITKYRSRLASYSLVLLAVFLPLLLRRPVEAWVGSGPPLIVFVPAVTVCAWYGGLWPGLTATALSALACVVLFFEPVGLPLVDSPNDRFRLAIFVVQGVLTSVLMERLHASFHRAATSNQEAEYFRAASRRSEDRLQAILDNSMAVVFMKDTSGRYVLVNNRFKSLFIRDGQEVLGKTAYEVFPRDVADVLSRNDREVIESRQAIEVEETIPEEDGPHTFVSLKFPLFDSAKAPIAIGGVSTDITTLKDAQRRALQSERLAAIGQMVAGLAHESRNALQRGQACLELLALRLKNQPQVLDLIAGIQQAQDDLHRYYEEVRNYAAPIRLERQTCSLEEIIHEAWDRLGVVRHGRVARLLTPSDPSPTCAVDRFRLVQVLYNVFDNALAASDGPSEIEVTWNDTFLGEVPAVSLTVRDNGVGFSAEQRKNLFEPFYTTKAHGTGLGLAIAKRVVDAHEGQIAVGKEDGMGATILITIPRGVS